MRFSALCIVKAVILVLFSYAVLLTLTARSYQRSLDASGTTFRMRDLRTPLASFTAQFSGLLSDNRELTAIELLRALLSPNDSLHFRSAINKLNQLQVVHNTRGQLQRIPRGANDSNVTMVTETTSNPAFFSSLISNWSGKPVVLDDRSVHFVIVIQTHDRVNYLTQLLLSLSNVVGVEHALLIVSHDYYSVEMDQLMSTVRFCPFLQIFFPYASAWFNRTYPADDINDCPRDMTREKAKEIKCNNAEWPDMYKHYREAMFVQTKQHYIWKLAFIYDELRVLRNFDGPLILLEDDYYVATDLLRTAALAYEFRIAEEKRSNNSLNRTSVFSLGHYAAVDYSQPAAVFRTTFESTKNNMGMMVDRALWNSLKSSGKAYCEYDDYNWDWTLQYLSMSEVIKGHLVVYSLKVPRVYHIGTCGFHHRRKSPCNAAADAEKVNKQLQGHGEMLMFAFTDFAIVEQLQPYVGKSLHKPNGGWADLRDQFLCKSIVFGPESVRANLSVNAVAAFDIVLDLVRFTSPLANYTLLID